MNIDHMVSDTNGSPYKEKVMCSIYRQQQKQLNVILRHRKWSISPEEDQWSSFSEVVMTKLTHLISAMTTTIHISYSSAQQYVQMCAPFTHTHRQVTKWYTGQIKYNSFQLFGDSPNKSCFFFVMVLFVTSIRTCQQDCVLIVSRCIEAGVLGYTFGQLPPVLSCPISHVRKLWHSKMTKRKWNHLTAGVLSFQTHTSRRISHPHCIMGHNSFIFSLRAFRTWLHGDLHTESLWADASGPLIYHVSPHCHSVTKSFLLDMDPFGEGAVWAGVAAREGLCHLAPFLTQDTVHQ